MNDTIFNQIKIIILEMDKPFSIFELLEKLADSGITDKEIILNVLNRLLNSGLVKPTDILEKPEMYCSTFAPITV